MFNRLRSLFGGRAKADPEAEKFTTRDANPVVTAGIMGQADGLKATAGSWETESAREDYELFCSQFCVEPETPFMQTLSDPQGKLKDWLEWNSSEAEPKAFVRLMLLLIKEGRSIRDEPGVIMLLEGRWSHGGGPSAQTNEALSLLSRSIQKPIKLYFHTSPDSPTMVSEYLPLTHTES